MEGGVRVVDGEHSLHRHDGPTCTQAVRASRLPGHLVHHRGERGEDPSTEIHSQELLLAQPMHSCTHKAVEGDHVAAEVEEGVVGEGGEDHGQTGGASSRVACEPLDHR